MKEDGPTVARFVKIPFGLVGSVAMLSATERMALAVKLGLVAAMATCSASSFDIPSITPREVFVAILVACLFAMLLATPLAIVDTVVFAPVAIPPVPALMPMSSRTDGSVLTSS